MHSDIYEPIFFCSWYEDRLRLALLFDRCVSDPTKVSFLVDGICCCLEDGVSSEGMSEEFVVV